MREGVNFLDLMVRQILDLRQTSGMPVRLLLMNSFSTSEDTLAHLQRYRAEGLADGVRGGVDAKPDSENRRGHAGARWRGRPTPLSNGARRATATCMPALVGSGWLDRLLAEGVKYAFVSNSDNLGAILDPAILAPFRGIRRALSDGSDPPHRRRPQGRPPRRSARPTAGCCCAKSPNARRPTSTRSRTSTATGISTPTACGCGSICFKEQLAADAGVLPLPMIRNHKTVDPRDKTSPAVIQLEIAMGAAIECFAGATAIEVPRSRFAPVKTTGDLLALRSDAYEVLDNGQVRLHPSRHGEPPVIRLADAYKLVDSLESLGVPSLIGCHSLRVRGPVRFAPGVVIQGEVEVENTGAETKVVAPGTYRDQHVNL